MQPLMFVTVSRESCQMRDLSAKRPLLRSAAWPAVAPRPVKWEVSLPRVLAGIVQVKTHKQGSVDVI